MASFEMKIVHELRPCKVAIRKGGEEYNALFHTWMNWAELGHAETYGIVEKEDGTVVQVYPVQIRFIDSAMEDYSFVEERRRKSEEM